jgi:hypothetical protein
VNYCGAYVALVRSQLEYASAVFATSAKTHLKKLDTIQKIASRIITGSPRNAHSAPLQESLRLDSLESRRLEHVVKLVESMVEDKSHPTFNDFFTLTGEGILTGGCTARTRAGKKRFKIAGAAAYNER